MYICWNTRARRKRNNNKKNEKVWRERDKICARHAWQRVSRLDRPPTSKPPHTHARHNGLYLHTYSFSFLFFSSCSDTKNKRDSEYLSVFFLPRSLFGLLLTYWDCGCFVYIFCFFFKEEVSDDFRSSQHQLPPPSALLKIIRRRRVEPSPWAAQSTATRRSG